MIWLFFAFRKHACIRELLRRDLADVLRHLLSCHLGAAHSGLTGNATSVLRLLHHSGCGAELSPARPRLPDVCIAALKSDRVQEFMQL